MNTPFVYKAHSDFRCLFPVQRTFVLFDPHFQLPHPFRNIPDPGLGFPQPDCCPGNLICASAGIYNRSQLDRSDLEVFDGG